MKNIFLALLLLCTAVSAKEPAKPLTYEELVSSALSDVSKLEHDLASAKRQSYATKNALMATKEELILTEKKVSELQTQIDEQTLLLEKIKTLLAQQVQETDKWKAKQEEALEKLWFWRKLAMVVVGVILLYVGYLAVRVYLKTKLPV